MGSVSRENYFWPRYGLVERHVVTSGISRISDRQRRPITRELGKQLPPGFQFRRLKDISRQVEPCHMYTSIRMSGDKNPRKILQKLEKYSFDEYEHPV